jgi:beta-glucanase (GH16 family)
MKTILLLLLTFPALAMAAPKAPNGWKLVWNDEFDRADFIDTRKWAPCERGGSDWNDTMTRDPRCYVVKGGRLQLRGFADPASPKDAPVYLTGGVTSKGKYQFEHGRIEIRARFKSAKGAWPALWLLGAKGGWPGNGEMDLMEHLNFDDKIYQTVHSRHTESPGKADSPPKGSTAPVKKDEFNIYGVEWDADKITFLVNGKPSHTYPRAPEKGAEQWPFDGPFYIIMSMQIGGGWVGKADPEDYPAWMEVDWVRVFERLK